MVNSVEYVSKASKYLSTLCAVKPNRRTGSPGNREATGFFASTIHQFGYEIDETSFDCLDYVTGKSSLVSGGKSFEIHISPYSLACDISSDLVTVCILEELKKSYCKGKILLMRGELSEEQLMPKNFVFYNPQHHQEIYAHLEGIEPAGIITATKYKPEQVGALYPFPLIVDGDFNIPNVYCTDKVGAEIAEKSGELFELKIESSRMVSSANNVIAQKNPGGGKKILLTAHIDAYEDTPGASDNASGVVVLMILAEMLADYQGNNCIEIAALNGEDHYSAGGQMDYLNRYGDEFKRVIIAVNVDDVGFVKGRSAFSFYNCSPELEKDAKSYFKDFPGLVEGEQWFNGDHMIFVQKEISSLAFTAEEMPELMATVTHTPMDTPEIIDPSKLVELAFALKTLINQL